MIYITDGNGSHNDGDNTNNDLGDSGEDNSNMAGRTVLIFTGM